MNRPAEDETAAPVVCGTCGESGFGAFSANDAAAARRRAEFDDGVRLAGPSARHAIRNPGNDRDYSVRADGYDPGGGGE